MKIMVALLYQLLRDVMMEVLINAALSIVRLRHHTFHTSWVVPSANHAADSVNIFGLNLWQGCTKIDVKTTNYISACIVNRRMNVSGIALTLRSTSWAKLWRDPKLACCPGWQRMVDGCRSEGNECWVDYIRYSSIFHSHLSYAIEVCQVNKIQNFSRRKSKLALRNRPSSLCLDRQGTLNFPCDHLCGMWTFR